VGPSGEFVLDYSIYDAIRAGFDRVVFVIRRGIEAEFRAAIGSRYEGRVAVDCVAQELEDVPAGFVVPSDRRKPWGTGHAILVCRNAVPGPFGVVNADDFYGRESFRILAGFLRAVSGTGTLYGMVGFTLRHTLSAHGHVARAICEVDSNGFLQSAVERLRVEKTAGGARFLAEDGQWRELTGDELVSMNMWGLTPSVFPRLEEQFREFLSRIADHPAAEFYIPAVVDRLIGDGAASVRVLRTPEKWIGVTYPQDKPLVAAGIRERVESGLYPADLWASA
jgi:NDP-sugar pyrophosphorylase family protein